MAAQDSKPLITTIIPTFRRPELLRRAIRSVLAETHPHFQVCVYDNASGDETASVVADLMRADSRIEYHCHSQNIGLFRNLSYGMDRVETPFFSFLCDDDVLLPAFYETALRGFEIYPDAIFSVLATLRVDDEGNVIGVPVLNWRLGHYAPPEGLLAILKHRHPDLTGILFRREVIKKVGILDKDVDTSADVDYELRATSRFPIAVSREPGAILVAHALSITNSFRFHATWPSWPTMIRNLALDKRIHPDVRALAEGVLTERLRSRPFMNNGFGSLVRRNWEDAFEAAA